MEDNNFNWEDDSENSDNESLKYSLGEQISRRYDQIDSREKHQLEEFILQLSQKEKVALEYFGEQNNTVLPKDNQSTNSISDTSSNPAGFLLSELLEKYISERKRNWGHKQAESTEHKDIRPKINLLIEIIGDKNSTQLNKSDIVKYKEVMLNFPSNRKKKAAYKDKSIGELQQLNIPSKDIVSDTTIKNHFTKISSFIAWCSDNDYSQSDLQKPLHGVIKKTKTNSQYRDTFEESDIIKLFNNDYYFRREHKKSSHYWVPLLALFTGARVNELCQLHVTDIRQVDGVWVIDINDDGDSKRLKNLNSKRLVPIHSTLIDTLKFLEYVKRLNDKEERLFPELKLKSDGYGQDFSKWFGRYRKKLGVGINDDEKKDFHSFRHHFSNYFKQLGIVEYRVSEIIGHQADTSITYGRYGKDNELSSKKELIEKLKFDFIEFKKFRHWI
jgi:integrase